MSRSSAVIVRTDEEDVDPVIQSDDAGACAVAVDELARIDFSLNELPSRVNYYRAMKKVARSIKSTRWPTYEASKCVVEIFFVKLSEVPLAYNPVRALIKSSAFDKFPNFRLTENCAYKIKPVGDQMPELISHEDYAEKGRFSHGVAKMYLKTRRRMWKNDDVYTEFAFANLVQHNLASSYMCEVWPVNKADTVNRYKKVLLSCVHPVLPSFSRKRALEGMTMYKEVNTEDDVEEDNREDEGEPETPIDLPGKWMATPPTIRALAFRHLNDDGKFADEKYDSPEMVEHMEMRLGMDEFRDIDKFKTSGWTLSKLQNLLLENKVLNEERDLSQEQWTHVLRAFRHTVSFIQGPPGTGKTKVLVIVAVALAIVLSKNAKPHPQMGKQQIGEGTIKSTVNNSVVAIVSKSNKACEVVVDRLRTLWPNFVWVTSHLRQRTVTDPSSLHMLAASRLKTNLEFSAWFHHYQHGTDLHRYGGHDRFLRLLQTEMNNVLNSVDLIVGTVRRMESLKTKHYSLWIEATLIDEASQLDELEACAAITFYSHRVCLCGDSKQLGPIYVRNHTKYQGLSEEQKSHLEYVHCGFFNRIVQNGSKYDAPRKCFMPLTTLYRMPWPQTEFLLRNVYERKENQQGPHIFNYKYDPMVLPRFNHWPHKLEYQKAFGTDERFFKKHQIAFVDTDSDDNCVESVGRGGTSLRNTVEGKMAVEFANAALLQYRDKNISVAIISMYNEQLHYIEQVLLETDNKLPVILSSVDGFQGSEADVVIISTVRKNKKRQIGFLGIEQRLTVALSRSRKVLLVLGSRKTLTRSPLWTSFARYASNVEDTADRMQISATERSRKVGSRKV